MATQVLDDFQFSMFAPTTQKGGGALAAWRCLRSFSNSRFWFRCSFNMLTTQHQAYLQTVQKHHSYATDDLASVALTAPRRCLC